MSVKRLLERVRNFAAQDEVWRGAAWGIGVAAVLDGLTYTAFGNSAASGPSSSLLAQAPWGMRLVGIVMLVVGIGVTSSANHREKDRAIVWMFASFVMGIIIICYTIGGWINAQQVAFGALSKWLLLSWLSLLLAATARRAGGSTNVSG